MGFFKSLFKSVEYFFSGTYNGSEGNDNIFAVSINLGWGSGIFTKGGDDSVTGAAFNFKIIDTWGDLKVFGAGGWTDISKTGNGNLLYVGASGGLKINHQGYYGNLTIRNVAAYSNISRIGKEGNINVWAAGAYTKYQLLTTHGDITVRGGAAYMNIQRHGANIFNLIPESLKGRIQSATALVGIDLEQQFKDEYGNEESTGNLDLIGVGAYVNVSSTVSHGNLIVNSIAGNGKYNRIGITSNVDANLAGLNNEVRHHSINGDTKVLALGGRNYIEKKGRYLDDGSNGNVYATLGGLRNNIYHGTDYGDTHLYGAAVSTLVTRKGLDGNVNIYGIGLDTEINITMLTGKLTYVGLAASSRINIKGYKKFQNNIHYDSSSYEFYKANISLVGLYNKINHQTEYGDIIVRGGGGYTEVKRTARNANLTALLAGYGNNVKLNSRSGNFTFIGAGLANVLRNNSQNGYTSVIAAGFGNSLTRVGNGDGNLKLLGGGNHINWRGIGNLRAKLGGATINHLTKKGDGDNEFILGGVFGNIVNVKGNGRLILGGLGIVNKINKEGNGKTIIVLFGGVNIYKQKGNGNIYAFMLGGGNILNKYGNGNIYALMAGGINSIFQKGNGNIYAGLLGGGNIITKLGDGNIYALMAGGANILTHIGAGRSIAVMFGGVNILTKIGDGLSVAVMFGSANIFTHVGNSDSIAVMIGMGNIFTKVGGQKEDLNIAVMLGNGNVFTQIGQGDTYAFMAGAINIFTKIGNGKTIVGMISNANIFTHIGDGTSIALMSGSLNVATKVGNGLTIGILYQGTIGNIFTHVGNGTTFGLLLGSANAFTKVGNGMTMVLMQGSGNIFTHVGTGISAAVMIGAGSVFTKVGDGITIALMFAPSKNVPFSVGNIYTHVGDGISLAVMYGGKANIFTKVGDGLSISVMIGGHANIFTHIGNKTSIALMANSTANIYTKVGDGLTLALMQGKANIMTHIGNGITVGLAHGKANIITKVGDGELGVGLYGNVNIVTHFSSKKSNTFSLVKGDFNIITKINPLEDLNITIDPLDGKVSDPVALKDRFLARGDITSNPMNVLNSVIDGIKTLGSSTYEEIKNSNGGMLNVVAIGKANIITHIGRGASNVIAHGRANIITKIGNGKNVVFANGKANIITTIGDGDSLYGIRGKVNIITKVGSGSSVAVAKGKGNIITKVGDGLHIGLMHGKGNLHTVVGDGMVINGQIGSLNINTKVGDGTSISVAKGKYNLNIQYGDGLGIYAGFGRGNISIKIGNGDYYGLAFEIKKGKLKDNVKESAKALLEELKGTGTSILASGTISRLVNADEGGTVTPHGHTVPKMQTPKNLEGSSYSLEEEKANEESTNDLSASVTDTSEDGNTNKYDKKGMKNSSESKLENKTKGQTNKSQKAQDNANKDKNRATEDVNKAQNKIENKNKKVTELRNKTNEVKEEDLKQNATKIQDFIQKQLINESSQLLDSSLESNSDTFDKENQQIKLKTKEIKKTDKYKYILIRRDTINIDINSRILNLSEIKLFSNNQDITKHIEDIKMSSIWDYNYTQINLIDNNQNTFAHTSGKEKNPWIQIRLDAKYNIDEIEITGRKNFNHRNTEIQIYLSNKNLSNKKITTLNSNTYKRYNIDFNGKIGRLGREQNKQNQHNKSSPIKNGSHLRNEFSTMQNSMNSNIQKYSQQVQNTLKKVQKTFDKVDINAEQSKIEENKFNANKKKVKAISASQKHEQKLAKVKNDSQIANNQANEKKLQAKNRVKETFNLSSLKVDNKINTKVEKNQEKFDFLYSYENSSNLFKQSSIKGVTIEKNSIVKSSIGGWNAGAFSNQYLEEDGRVSTTVLETNTARMIGLSYKDENQHYNDIDYAIFLEKGGYIFITEKGIGKRSPRGQERYQTGDVLQVQRRGDTISYLKNEKVFYVSNTKSRGELFLDTSLNDTGATLMNIEFGKEKYLREKRKQELFKQSSIKGVTIEKNSIVKSSIGGWNAGAFSNQYLEEDGRVSTTVLETNTARMIGLSYKDENQHYNDIDYAIFLEKGGYIFITEKGIGKRSPRGQERYQTGDVLQVQRRGDTISYLKNEKVFYVSNTKSRGELFLDTSLNDTGATLMNIEFGKEKYLMAGIRKNDNNFIKTSNSGWNSEVFSKEFISVNGSVSATVLEINKDRMFGLSNSNKNQNYNSIDYAVFLMHNATLAVYENGVLKGNFGTYKKGDVFKVRRTSDNIDYLKNDEIFYTSLIQSTHKLYFDSSFRNKDATLINVNIKDDFFTSILGVEVNNNSIKKISNNTSWDAGAFLNKTIENDGSIKTTIDETTTNKAIGLSYNKKDNISFSTIDHAIYLNENSKFCIMEKGNQKTSLTVYNKGDIFDVQRDGSFIKYYHNNNLVYTSTSTFHKTLYVQTALYNKGAVLKDIEISLDVFTKSNNKSLKFFRNNILQTSVGHWNAGTFSKKGIKTDGYVSTTVDETNTNRVIGLSNEDINDSYNSIDYAIYLNSHGNLSVYENAYYKGDFGIYKTGDIISVQRIKGVITYLKNYKVFYTSDIISKEILYADTSFASTNSTLNNIVIKDGILVNENLSDILLTETLYENTVRKSLHEAQMALRINTRNKNQIFFKANNNILDKIKALKSKISSYHEALKNLNDLRKNSNDNKDNDLSVQTTYSMNELPIKKEGTEVDFYGQHLGSKDILDNDNFSIKNLESIVNKLKPDINSEIKNYSDINTLTEKETKFFNDTKKVILNPEILHLKLSDTITAMIVSKDKDFAYAIFEGDKQPLVDATGSLRNQFNVSSHTLDYVPLKSLQENGSSGLSSLVSILASSDFDNLDEMKKSKIFNEKQRSIHINNKIYTSKMWKSENIDSILQSIDDMKEKDKYTISIKDKDSKEIYKKTTILTIKNRHTGSQYSNTRHTASEDGQDYLAGTDFNNNDKDSKNMTDILRAIDEGVSSLSLNQNIDKSFEEIISLSTFTKDTDLKCLQFSKKHIDTLQRDEKINLSNNIDNKEITFTSKYNENSFNYKAIYNEVDEKYDIFYKNEHGNYDALKTFTAYTTNNLELNKNDVEKLIQVDGVKTQYFNNNKKLKLETSIGEIYNIELNINNQTYNIFKEVHNKKVQLLVNEHTFNEGDEPKLILNKNAKKNLENINFEEIYNNAINNGIRAENSDGELFHDSLPDYVATTLDKDNIRLEVYEQNKNGKYKNILESFDSSVEYNKSIKIIREEINGKYVYSIANINEEGLINKKANITNKNNSLFLAIDAQVNEHNYEIIPDPLMENEQQLKIKNFLESKKTIQQLRNSTALIADKAISKVAKEMLNEMNTGDLRVDYRDQILSALKTTLVQHGISYFFTPAIKFALSFGPANILPDSFKTFIAKLITVTLHSFLTQFVLPNKNLKPNGAQIDTKNDNVSKLVEATLATSVYTVACGISSGLNIGLYTGVSDVLNVEKENNDTKYLINTEMYQQFMLGVLASSATIAATKVKLAKEGKFFAINKAEVEKSLKKTFNDSKIIGKKIAKENKKNKYSFFSSIKNIKHWRGMLDKFLNRAVAETSAELGSGYLSAELKSREPNNFYDGTEHGYNVGEAMLLASSLSATFVVIHLSVGYAAKYTYGINSENGYIRTGQFSEYLKDFITNNKGNLELDYSLKKGLNNLSKLDSSSVLNGKNKESINILLAGLFFEVNANAREVIEKNINQDEQGLNALRNKNVELAFKEFNVSYKSMLENITMMQDKKTLSNEDKILLKNTLQNKVSELKQKVENIQNAIPSEDSKLRGALVNSLNLVEVVSETLNDIKKINKIIKSPYDKNHSIVFNQKLMEASKIGNKYILIEKVYYNDDGEKIIISPFIDVINKAEVITVRQYGNTFKYMEDGKEKTMKKQNSNDNVSLNLSRALFDTFELDFDDKKLKNIIKITNKTYENNTNIQHLSQIKTPKDMPLEFWNTLNEQSLHELNEASNRKKMSNYDHQIIIQTQNDETVRQYSKNLAQKHPEQTTIIQMSKDGEYKVIYGKNIPDIKGKLRVTPVGYGNITVGDNKQLGGRSVNKLAQNLKILNNDLNNARIKNVSLVSCQLGNKNSKTSDFGQELFNALTQYDINSNVSVRNNYVAVQDDGRKITSDTGNADWFHKNSQDKVEYKRDKSEKIVKISTLDNDSNRFVVKNKNIEDIELNKVGDSLSKNSAIIQNNDSGLVDSNKMQDISEDITKFQTASDTTKHSSQNFNKKMNESNASNNSKSKKSSIGGNIQINVGDGEHTTLYKGSTNIDIKIGDGGHKTGMFGDNNVLISIGDRSVNQKHTQKVGSYVAFEGAQVLIGQRNIDYNYGNRNDFIVMLDKSIPVLPFLNPFDGASGISKTLKQIAASNKDEQETLWSFEKAKTFTSSMSVLDLTSSVEYTTLFDVNSQNQVSTRGVRYDTEAYLNNLVGGGGIEEAKVEYKDSFKTFIKDSGKAKFKKMKASIKNTSINFTVAGRGSDIVIANGNFSFIFADNIQSVLDTTIASFLGIMQQGFTSSGAPTNTFTFSSSDLKTQMGNQIKNKLALLTEDITVGELFNYGYNQNGQVYAEDGRNLDLKNLTKELFSTILQDSYKDVYSIFTNPTKIWNTVKAMGSTGGHMIKNGLEALGFSTVSKEALEKTEQTPEPEVSTQKDESPKSFGFSGLSMPSLFDFSLPNIITKIPALVKDLKDSLVGDAANMKDKVLDFFTQTGYMSDDGDLILSLGSQNFVWGGHGKDLIALLGTNNNVWAGEGDDVGYLMGEGNTFSGNSGDDTAVLMGQNHMFIGGSGDDFAVSSGRYNTLMGGAGNDQLWVFGTRGRVTAGSGDDYVVATGNYHDINTGSGDDFSIVMGAENLVYLGEGNDQAKIFGNKNKVMGALGRDTLDIYSYEGIIETGADNDTVKLRAKSKSNVISTGSGTDTIFVGGLNNKYLSGEGADVFVMTNENIEGEILDSSSEDLIVFNNFSYKDVWFEKKENDLIVHTYNGLSKDKKETDDKSRLKTQEWFEEFGALQVSDYFQDTSKRAAIVTSATTNSNGEIVSYEYLDNNTIDKLVEIMATANISKGEYAFMTDKSDNFVGQIELSWNKRIQSKIA